MKKKISVAFFISILLVDGLYANNIENMQQKMSIILAKKVEILKNKIILLENNQIQLKNKLAKFEKDADFHNSFLTDTNNSSTSNDVLFKKDVNENNTTVSMKSFKNLYQIHRECKTYKSENSIIATSKMYKTLSYVEIIQKGKNRSKTSTGLWIKNNCFDDIKKQKEDVKGVFYFVRTYMANTRIHADADSYIVAVLRKNDIILVQGKKVKSKGGGFWLKTKNYGYINARIVRPYSNKIKTK